MNIKELYATLEQDGWSFGNTIKQDSGVTWYAYRRLIGGAECLCNERAPSICIQPYALHYHGKDHFSAEIEVTGQNVDGHWVSFKVYGINFEDVANKTEVFTKLLRTAWNSINPEESK